MEFPRKYPLATGAKILVLCAIIFGIWMHRHTQDKLEKNTIISDVQILAYTPGHIELGYSIESTHSKAVEISLLAVVWDADDAEIASIMFPVKTNPGIKQRRSKSIMKLTRPLRDGEAPHRAAIRVYKRKII